MLYGMSEKFSIISVYNNRRVLEDWLLSSLENEDEELYEKILVDNREDRFSSAAEALNHGADKAEGDYYVFVHQDVRLEGKNWLSRLSDDIESAEPEMGLMGVSGMRFSGGSNYERMLNTIYHGENKDVTGWSSGIDYARRVQTVDELLFVIPSQLFDELGGFDEDACFHWHMYAVEFCLRILKETQKAPYVASIPVWHKSKGMPKGSGYYRTVVRIADKYPEFDMIYTTCGEYKLNPVSVRIRLLDEYVGRKIGYWPLRAPSALLRKIFSE